MNSEAGYTPEDAVGLEETAPGVGAHHAVAVGRPLSTQKKFELKTKLRCSCERRPRTPPPWQGGAGPGPPDLAVGASDSPGPPRRPGEQGHPELPPLVRPQARAVLAAHLGPAPQPPALPAHEVQVLLWHRQGSAGPQEGGELQAREPGPWEARGRRGTGKQSGGGFGI